MAESGNHQASVFAVNRKVVGAAFSYTSTPLVGILLLLASPSFPICSPLLPRFHRLYQRGRIGASSLNHSFSGARLSIECQPGGPALTDNPFPDNALWKGVVRVIPLRLIR